MIVDTLTLESRLMALAGCISFELLTQAWSIVILIVAPFDYVDHVSLVMGFSISRKAAGFIPLSTALRLSPEQNVSTIYTFRCQNVYEMLQNVHKWVVLTRWESTGMKCYVSP